MQEGAERRVRVRAHELSPLVGDRPRNVDLISDAFRAAAESGVQLLVLPELATSGYYLRDRAEARAVAMTVSDEQFDAWSAMLAPGMTAVLGFCEVRDGELFNSAAVLAERGVIAVYRKIHLWDDEKLIFTAGNEPPVVVDTPAGRLGTIICYDLEFPEMPRSLAVNGAEIIAIPTNWPLLERPVGERAPEVVQAMAAARSSTVAIVCCDRAGDERGHAWTEGTSIVGSDGWLRGVKEAEGILDAELTVGSNRARIGPRNHVFDDRRPNLYSGLS